MYPLYWTSSKEDTYQSGSFTSAFFAKAQGKQKYLYFHLPTYANQQNSQRHQNGTRKKKLAFLF